MLFMNACCYWSAFVLFWSLNSVSVEHDEIVGVEEEAFVIHCSVWCCATFFVTVTPHRPIAASRVMFTSRHLDEISSIYEYATSTPARARAHGCSSMPLQGPGCRVM